MPELRKDPITAGWVIFAPERATRPNELGIEDSSDDKVPCPFCPGREAETPEAILEEPAIDVFPDSPWGFRIVPDAFPIFTESEGFDRWGEGMFDLMTGHGYHELVIESPLHKDDLDTMPASHLAKLLGTLQSRTQEILNRDHVVQVVIARNRGAAAGASIHHPHSHLVGLPVLPKKVRKEIEGSGRYYRFKDRCPYCDIVQQELQEGSRIVLENEAFVAFCTYAAQFPFEVSVLPRHHRSRFEDTPSEEIALLADLLKKLVGKFKSVFTSPPLNYMLHTCPSKPYADRWLPDVHKYYHWHIEIIPIVTRVAGFEWGTGFYINPMLPEVSARYLLGKDAETDSSV